MFTTVIVGSSTTFVDRGRMVTPRIYAAKTGGSRHGTVDARGDVGAAIMAESLAIIDRELGPDPEDPAERAVVRRMIHASADFDFASSVRFSPAGDRARPSRRSGRGGLSWSTSRCSAPGSAAIWRGRSGSRRSARSAILAPIDLAASEGLTRSAAGFARAAERVGDGAVVAIGNAPTALMEAIRLVEHEGWRPACIVGIPVGFVGVEESKRRLVEQADVPFVTSLGRKGGTAVTAAAINALLELAGSETSP